MTADFNYVVNQHTSESGLLSGLSLVMQKKLMISYSSVLFTDFICLTAS